MPVFWNRSLLARLISSFLLLSLVMTGVAGVVAFVQANDTLEASVIERLRVAALARQDELDVWVDTQANDLTFVARWEEVLQSTSTLMTAEPTSLDYQVAYTRLAETLRDVVVRRPDFDEVFILKNNGTVAVSSQRSSEGQELHTSRYFIVGQTQTFIQNVYPDPRTGQPTMTIATPLLDSLGRRIGVLAVHLNLERMDRIILDRAGLGETGEMYLVDKRGMFVSARRFGRQNLTHPMHSEGINRALAGENGTGRYLNYRGVPVIGAYQCLERFELALLVEMEQREAFAPTNQLALSITLAGLAAASILAVGVYLLARQIARPILQLTDAAREVAAGNLTVTAPVVTRDEIGVLAQVFNQMTTQLRGLYERMEQQVAARTAELTHTNEQLTGEIAERQRIEDQLRHARDDAEAANRAKSTFLANMSHELRTPLSAIIGFAQLMQRGPSLTPDQQEFLGIINRSGQHLRDLINDVLEMSKIEAGRVTLNESQFDLPPVLNDVEKMFQLRTQEKGLQLVVDCAPDVPTSLHSDERKLRQVLINLLSNAVKFTQAGRVTLRVRTQGPGDRGRDDGVAPPRAPNPDLRTLVFEVEDTGPGIAPDELPTLFQAFGQTRTGQQAQEGTGLGLAISRRFVQLMGGDITVQSEVGCGSVFTFDITVPAAEPAEAARPDEDGHLKVLRLAPDQPAYRVLVVDDMVDNRHLLVRLLERVGFTVREASNGQQAVEVWEQWFPHLIWMDIRMPVMDGYEATRCIKSRAAAAGKSTAIVALSASAFEEEQSRILAAGCDGFVGKPFRDTDIFEHMARFLGVRYLYKQRQGENRSGK
jgi:signal transduction histidine kinase